MSETTLGRALEFMRQPQDVDVYSSGQWVSASLIGWRQEQGSSCRLMVRISQGGREKTAWAELQDVRLAEHRDSPPTESLPFLPRIPEGPIGHTARTTTSDRTADDVRPGLGRHRASVDDGHDTALQERRRHHAWWLSSDWPVPDEVEPTRLLPLRKPRWS